MLYFRMLVTMLVSLYTSRIVLEVLGIEDFGIYNVVGGFVVMFGFLNSAMSTATQRYFAYEIGRNDQRKLHDIFNMSINIHIIIALLIVLLAESLGLWFLNTQLNIDSARIPAANWVYQFSVFALVVNIISVPYNAMIIAHERMNVFAWVSVIEVVLKLIIVYLLQWSAYDKLVIYAIMIFSITLIIKIIYAAYCSRKIKESRYKTFWDTKLFYTLIHYAGWNLWGNFASVMMGQGVNILLNIFFGPVVNAARGIAFQVKAAIMNLVMNFQMAINPQIVKYYASDNIKQMHHLVFQGTKFSFFLLFTVSLPILFQTHTILQFWLKTLPDYAVIFTQLIIVNALIDALSGTLMTAAQATGKIKKYQSVVGGLLLLNIPISYLFLRLGFPPQTTVYISISLALIALLARLKIISALINLSIYEYLRKVICPIIIVIIVSITATYGILHFMRSGLVYTLILCIGSVVSVLLSSYFLGLTKSERDFFSEKLKSFTKKQ